MKCVFLGPGETRSRAMDRIIKLRPLQELVGYVGVILKTENRVDRSYVAVVIRGDVM